MKKIYKYFSSCATKLKSIFSYCGLTSEQFNSIRDVFTKKNEIVLYATAITTMILGPILFIVNIISASLAIYPCLFMIISGIFIFLTKFITNKRRSTITFLCYLMFILLLTASAVTSFLPSNRDIPATTFVAFLTLIPLLISDSPDRMTPVVIFSGATYILLPYIFKDPSAFKLDAINTITFLIIGIFLYVVMMRRTAMEIWQTMHVKVIQGNIVNTLASVVEARDGVTGEHILNTQNTVNMIVEEMKNLKEYEDLSNAFFDDVCKAAPLHDIGKMCTPDAILSKPGRLTPDEFEIMKKHAVEGADIIEKITKNSVDKQFSQIAYNVVKYHHERWDGTGYPCKLKGNDIPLEARIMAIADVYDALISLRPYKKPFSKEEAIKIIRDGMGTQFDSRLVEIFLKVSHRLTN